MPLEQITVFGYRCTRCDHTWVPRGGTAPRVCPKCKSPYWDRPRANAPGDGARMAGGDSAGVDTATDVLH